MSTRSCNAERVNAQDFEALERTIHRRALDAADRGHPGGWGATFVAALAAEVDALIGPGSVEAQDFEAFEEALRRQALGIAAQMAAERFNADHSDRLGSTIACACGRPAQYVSRRPKTFITLMGPMRLERAYYYCPACRRGSCPRDRALDLQDTSLSPGAHPAGGHDGGRGQLRQGERVVGGPGRGGGRDPAGRALRRGARPRNRP